MVLCPKLASFDLFVAFSFASKAVWVEVEMGLAKSLVLSTLPKPTSDLLIPETSSKVAVPVNEGETIGAFAFKAVSVALLTGLFASLVLSTLAKLTMALVIPVTVPVNAGSCFGALSANPGTVGNRYVPPKSPANWIFPTTVVLA